MKMKKVRVTQVKSGVGRPERQKKTLEALGLKKIRHTIEHDATPQIMGMIKKVEHLVKVEEI
jgi:large subunit ribosomal protein L30